MTNRTGNDPGATLRDAARLADERAGAAAERFTVLASDQGLVDVAYTNFDSPFGPILLAATDRGLVKVAFPVEPVEDVLARLAGEISPRVLEDPSRLEDARRELDRYFEGRLRQFETPLDWQLTHGFRRRVLRATARVPYGGTSTYSGVAAAAGSPRAFRAAGTALGANPLPIIVPCHRILREGGALGGYGGGLDMKQELLRLEGALE